MLSLTDSTSRIDLVFLVLAFVILLNPSMPRSETGGDQSRIVPEVSPNPTIDVLGGSPEEVDRVHLALDRFAAAGLDLPDLEIVFAGGHECGRRLAFFQERAAPWRITICSRLDFVYEHELAHAWERANLTDEAREAFMAANGYGRWSGEGVAWGDRGVEGVAIVIQQGVSGLALHPQLGATRIRRLLGYELLTGRPAPILLDLLESRAVLVSAEGSDQDGIRRLRSWNARWIHGIGPRSGGRAPGAGEMNAGRGWLWGNVPVPEPHLVAIGASLALRMAHPWRKSRPGWVRKEGAILVATGVAMGGWATRSAGRTDLADSRQLVTGGAYALSRHPMYVGWTLIYLGYALMTDSVWPFVLVPGLAASVHRTVLREERRLETRSGSRYRSYARRVPRYV